MSQRNERQHENQGRVLTRTQTEKKVQRPPMYKVLLHNDDYTPREFVVFLLEHIFHMGEAEATSAMLHVHNNGVGVIGLYPYSIAETKVVEVMSAAEKSEYPLMCTMEPEGQKGDTGREDDTPT